MKILFVINDLKTGGAEVQLKKLIELYPRKSEITLISLISKGQIGVDIENLGVKVYNLNLNKFYFFPSGFIKFIYLIISLKPNIVHTWMYHSNLFAGVIAKIFRVKKIIWSIHQYDLSKNYNSLSTLCIIKLGAFLSSFVPSKIICVSNNVKLNHIAFGYCEEIITVIHNGINTNDFKFNQLSYTDLRKKLHLNDDIILIGFFARYHPIKGHLAFLKAIKNLTQLVNEKKFHILLVGEGCDCNNQELISELNSLKIKNKVSLIGLIYDVPYFMSSLDLFVSASENEAFSLVLAEAMSVGVPCVSTINGDPANLLNIHGFLCNDNSPHSLANIISIAINEKKNITKWNQRKTEGRRLIVEKFSIEKMLIEYNLLWN